MAFRWARTGIARRGLALWLGALAASGCESAQQRWEEDEGEVVASFAPGEVDAVLGQPMDSLRVAIAQRLAADPPEGVDAHDWRHVRELYAVYGNGLLWFDREGLHDRAGALVDAVANAHTEALRLDAYPVAEVREAVAALAAAPQPRMAPLIQVDLLLSSMFVALAADMIEGQIDPHGVSQGWHVGAPETDVSNALARTLRMDPLDRAIARLRPQTEDFDALRDALKLYRDIVERGGWPSTPEGTVLEPGDTSSVERLEALRARLLVEDHVDQDVRVEPLRDSTGAVTDRALYDGPLAGAVARFQAHHGIVVDSILGRETVRSLNAPAEYRLRQIAANLERSRWLPSDLGQRFVVVNVPAFRLEVVERGQRVLDMKVIVGAEYNNRATPAFSDSMSYVVFRPYWNVPEDIAINEILPAAYSDAGYMARNGYEVVQGGGDDARVVGQYAPSADAIASGAVRIRQRPGAGNALGDVKFIFPNDFAIYLHDTPTTGLFQRDVRAFSHGCIRVENPEALARYALGWDEAQVRSAMTSGPVNRRVDLRHKLPVYILYLTTYVRDGELYFGNDLYDRDAVLTRAVAAAALPPSDQLREVERLRRSMPVD